MRPEGGSGLGPWGASISEKATPTQGQSPYGVRIGQGATGGGGDTGAPLGAWRAARTQPGWSRVTQSSGWGLCHQGRGDVSRTSWAMGKPLAFTLRCAAALSLLGRSRVFQGSDS